MPANLLMAAALFAVPPPPHPEGQDIVVESSAARPAIMRILEADNLDIERLPAAEVAAQMQEITRGAAPADFWDAYREHVQAWTAYALAKAQAREADPLDVDRLDGRAIASARRRVNSTFDAVETIAKRYGAWPPRVPTRL